MHKLYTGNAQKLMNWSEEVSGNEINRLQKIKKFALLAGYKKIGIAHCVSFTHEAKILEEYFSDKFEVFSVNCKIGKYRKSDFFNEHKKGFACNPLGQADFLAKHKTELNFSIGLCVGHDMLFNQASEVPVTNLFVKDKKNKHDLKISLAEIQQDFI